MENLLKRCKDFIKENPTYYGLELTVSDVKKVVEAIEKCKEYENREEKE